MAKTNSMTAEDILALADHIILPDAKAFKELANQHKLNDEQAWALTRTVKSAIEKEMEIHVWILLHHALQDFHTKPADSFQSIRKQQARIDRNIFPCFIQLPD